MNDISRYIEGNGQNVRDNVKKIEWDEKLMVLIQRQHLSSFNKAGIDYNIPINIFENYRNEWKLYSLHMKRWNVRKLWRVVKVLIIGRIFSNWSCNLHSNFIFLNTLSLPQSFLSF